MNRLHCVLAAALAVAVSGGAQAQAPVSDILYGAPGADLWQHNGFYVGAGGRYGALQVPRIGTPGQSRLPTGGINATTAGAEIVPGHAHHFGPEARLGYAFADGTFPAWLGRNARVELGGHFVTTMGNNRTNQDTGNIFTGISISSVDGSASIGAFGAPIGLRTVHSFNAWQYRMALRAKTDFEFGHVFLLTPSLGIYGGEQKVGHRLTQVVNATGTGDLINYNLDARVRWRDIGGALGLDVTYKATPWLAFFLGGRLNLAYRHASLNANDNMNSPFFGLAFATATSASSNYFAYTGGGELGVIFGPGGPWTLALTGGIEYDSKTPTFRVQSNNGAGAGACPCVPAGLGFRSTVNYSASAKLAIRLW